MPATVAGLFSEFVFKPVMRPVFRVISGLIAIPLFRFILKRLFKMQTHDAELERDLENWFRGAILMLAATANLESFLFGWTPWYQQAGDTVWQTLLLRLLLAVGVIESMPDEDVFTLLHRGPPKLKLTSRAGWREAWRLKVDVLRGILIVHLRRSTPVFAIMTVIFGGPTSTPLEILHHKVGWWCYGLAITQYLIIAMITQRDRVAGLLDAIGQRSSAGREEIIHAAAGSTAVSNGDDDDPNLALPGKD